jgi:NADPH:quinone reductase-like Zn-dependent oxidoreductase
MRAVVYTKYGAPDVLQLKQVDKPAPKANELLIRVYATSVGYGDILARNFKAVSSRQFNMPWLFWLMARLFFGWRKPRVNRLGSEFAGEVESVGKDVRAFKPGDPVFGYLGQKMGAYAEYLCIPENGCVAPKPANVSYEEAATIPYGAIMALPLLQRAGVRPGQKVLILGASGGIGSAAVQLARSHFGALVSGVCSTPRLELVKSLGADAVIDYTQEDFTRRGEQYDLIFDVLGRSSFSRAKQALKPGGIHLYASFKLKQLRQMLWTSLRGDKRVVCALAPGSREDLLAVKELIETGKLRPIVDRCYPLEQTAEAHRYVESGRKKGNVAIVCIEPDHAPGRQEQRPSQG